MIKNATQMYVNKDLKKKIGFMSFLTGFTQYEIVNEVIAQGLDKMIKERGLELPIKTLMETVE